MFNSRQNWAGDAIKMEGTKIKEIPRNSANVRPLFVSISAKNSCQVLSSNNISHLFLQQKFLCMVLEFLPGGDLEKLITYASW